MTLTYILVEGPHDAAFVAKILTLAGLRLVRQNKDLDPYWQPLIPETFPVNDNLIERVPIPVFFQNENFSVAVHSAGSDSLFSRVLNQTLYELTLKNKPLASLSGIGAIIDADQSPATRFTDLRSALLSIPSITKHFPDWPTDPGHVATEAPRTGIFVMPDNTSAGTLESLLLDAANTTWPQILQNAKTYVAESKQHLSPTERTQIDKPSGTAKATAACIADLLRPGYAIQNSIKDDNWLTSATLTLPRIAALQTFLHQLTGLSIAPK